MSLLDNWSELTSQQQEEQLKEFVNSCDSESNDDKKLLIQLWRESNREVKLTIDSDTYSKIIDIMKNDVRRLSKIWFLTPEKLQERESNILGNILEYSIDDVKRYKSIWKTTSPRVQEQYKDISEKMDMLNKLEAVNTKVIDTINIKMLDEKYTSTLSFEQLQMITCYPKEQKRLLELTDQQYNILSRATSGIEDIQTWRYEFSSALDGIHGFDNLIEDISSNQPQNIDYHKILMILHQPNYFGIQNYEDVEKIDETKSKLFDAIKNNDNDVIKQYPGIACLDPLDRKKLILLECLYNINTLNANHIIKLFGRDISDLSETEENSKLQEMLLNVKTILDAKDEKDISDFFEMPLDIRNNIDSITLEMKLKNAYNEEYNKQLTQVGKLPKLTVEKQKELGLDGFNVLDAGVDFNFIITSIAPYNANSPGNFYEDWNRKETYSQGFCCSYIRNDMLGHAPVPHLCYGFSNMESDSLMLSGADDISSSTSEGIIEVFAHDRVEFCTPNNQINRVADESQYGFNEMVYNRIQNGKKKQPDFIVAFMRDGNIPNEREIRMAVEQYRVNGMELPVVVIDEDKCIESEKSKLTTMRGEFEKNPTKELFEKISQKAKNNSVANALDFYEFSNFIHNDYETMQEIVGREKEQKTPEEWLDRCQNWYETPERLPQKIKGQFLELKKKITETIKSKLIRKKQGEKIVANDERDEQV